MRRLLATILACAATACGLPPGEDVDARPPDAGLDAGLDGPAATGGFAIGAEYSELGLGAAYGALGVRWAKPRVELAEWGAIEPAAPAGGVHTYAWSCVDRIVVEHQQAGMDLQVYLTPRSSWASVGANDIMPRAERMADYRAWVRALVERYDGDGVDDAPGLVRPVRDYVVGAEWTGFWPSGDAADYLALAEATRGEARAAFADVRLGMIPFMMVDVFAGDPPTAAEIAARLADPPPAYRQSTAGMMAILDRPELFDYVDVHSLGDYTELPPLLAWLRAQMAARGYHRPIWIDDAFPISYLANRSNWPALHPVTAAQYPAIVDLLADLAKLQEPAYTRAMRWLRAETAKGTIQKIVTALGEGAAGINLGNSEDWMHDTLGGLRDLNVSLIGAAVGMGMIDVTHPRGYQLCDARTAGALRPAARDLALAIAMLGNGAFDRVERLAHADPHVRGYRFTRAGKELIVAWYEDRVLQLPGEVEAPVVVQVPVPDVVAARVTTAVTTPEEEAPASVILAVSLERVSVRLTSIPVFIEPAP